MSHQRRWKTSANKLGDTHDTPYGAGPQGTTSLSYTGQHQLQVLSEHLRGASEIGYLEENSSTKCNACMFRIEAAKRFL